MSNKQDNIDTKHPHYMAMKSVWDECQDALGGQPTIKAKGETHLPATSGMKNRWENGGKKMYDAYRKRARFSDISAESLEGILGIMFSKDAEGSLDEIVTKDGMTVYELSREIAEKIYSKGRHILVVEAPPTPGSNPYIVQYPAESLINWKVDDDGKLTIAVFTEKVPDNDPYTHETKIRYREYTKEAIKVYDEEKNLIEEYKNAVGQIEVVVIGSKNCSTKVDKPPMARVVECALAAYRNSADYQQGLFLTAQPTPYSSGCTKEQYDLNNAAGLGVGAHWYLGPDIGAKSGYLEFAGQGLAAIKEAQDSELETAADYAVKLSHTNGVEAAAAKQIRDASQKSVVQMMADSISIGINTALDYLKARSISPRKFEYFQLNVQTAQAAESTMIAAIGNRVNAGKYPVQVEYNYALKHGLFSGTFQEWLDQIETGGHDDNPDNNPRKDPNNPDDIDPDDPE